MIRNAIILWTALAAASPAVAADTFDLVCNGKTQLSPTGPETPSRIRFTVDIRNRLYCSAAEYGDLKEKCSSSLTIDQVTPSRIGFIMRDAPKPLWYMYVNRTDGSYVWFSVRPYHNEKGRCELAPFSGFPTTKF